jgi:hypothetical protein
MALICAGQKQSMAQVGKHAKALDVFLSCALRHVVLGETWLADELLEQANHWNKSNHPNQLTLYD